MTNRAPARTEVRRSRSTMVAALVVGAVLICGAVLVVGDLLSGDDASGRRDVPGSSGPARRVRDGETAFEDQTPAVANLDPALLSALRRAATDAADDDVTFRVNSGWRSAADQERLLRAATSEYGSAKEASRWVATPRTSPHVSGHAIDLGPPTAARWLAKYGFRYGLCRIYRNEPWHYELRPQAVDHGCPSMYADPTHDPRMQR